MSIKISGTDAIDNNRKGLFQSANIGTFNPGNRPGSASTGDIIYNTSTAQMEVWNGSSWVRACGVDLTEYSGTGGNEIVTSNGHKIHIFTSPGTFSISPGAVVEYVVLAGGGSGYLASQYFGGGGGGAGGLIYNTATLGGSYSVSVGAGAAAPPSSPGGGSNSSIPTLGVTATGGGAGGGVSFNPGSGGQPGGCGGGTGGNPFTGGDGNTPPTSPIQGFPGRGGGGALAGGGGGVMSIGKLANPTPTPQGGYGGDGGDGISLEWGIPPSYGAPDPKGNPSVRTFGGGGGGGVFAHTSPPGIYDASPRVGQGGSGGGGDASAVAPPYTDAPPNSNGVATSGGGGGGGSRWGTIDSRGGAGGSGIVMFRYRIYQ